MGFACSARGLIKAGFIWPRMSDPGCTVMLSPAQLAMLIEGIE